MRQNITTSRSFGDMIMTIEQVKASVATFAASCANKLRGQSSAAGCVTVFLCSNFFRDDLEQYYNAATLPFCVPTTDTIEITRGRSEVSTKVTTTSRTSTRY